jgi:protein import protein ZIM17
MSTTSSAFPLLLLSQQRLISRFQNRAHRRLAQRSFCRIAHHRHRESPTGSSAHAFVPRSFHSSHIFLKYKYYDSFNLDSNEQTSPKTAESRRDGDIELSGINTNEEHDERESFTDIPGTTNTKAKTLAIIYTCKVCNTRSAKQFTEQAYKHGVVLVKCPGCQNHHLIADRLGWFEDRGVDGKGWDVEKLLTEVGENVKAVSGNDVLELTLDDIAGTKTEG